MVGNMKWKSPCVRCFDELGFEPRKMTFLMGEFDEEGRVRLVCEKQHNTVVIVDATRHQILLTSGGMAFLSGFANEAVAVLNTALERAYEHFIRVVCRAKGIEVKLAWPQVGAQSERQFGAFVFLYLLTEGVAPQQTSELAAIRNRVVHKGEIVNDRVAETFGEEVFKRIQLIETALYKYTDHARAELEEQLLAQEASLPPMPSNAVARVKMTSLEVSGDQVVGKVKSFRDFVESLREARLKGMS
ncbi:hypothetical protein J7E70_29365 [Variovorax paradoxus]|nr:hypothetical protein [Variovorax paradoxus]MBT2304540.1 hypothetical protein [Variovorax paradoxus]